MNDVVQRLRWWAAKKKPPAGMPTLPADCAAGADEIERLRAETTKLTVACAAYEVEAAGLREQLAAARNNAPLTSPLPFPAIWHAQHRKRGTTYWVHGYGRLQTDVPIANMTEVVVYRSEDDGSIWVRPVREFEDGRFKVLNPKGDGE